MTDENDKFARLRIFLQFTSRVWVSLGVLALVAAPFFESTLRLLLIGIAALVILSGAMLYVVLDRAPGNQDHGDT